MKPRMILARSAFLSRVDISRKRSAIRGRVTARREDRNHRIGIHRMDMVIHREGTMGVPSVPWFGTKATEV